MTRIERPGSQTPFVTFNVHRCKACWKCLEKCPEVIAKVSFLWHKHVVIRRADECIGCLKCVKACPEGAFVPVATRR